MTNKDALVSLMKPFAAQNTLSEVLSCVRMIILFQQPVIAGRTVAVSDDAVIIGGLKNVVFVV